MSVLVETYGAFEAFKNQGISASMAEMETLNGNLDTIVQCLIQLKSAAANGAVDFSEDAAKRTLIDKLYEVAPHFLPGDQQGMVDRYRWSKDEAETLIQNLTDEQGRFHPQINLCMSKITQAYQERNQVTDIVGEILKEMREAVRSFLSRIGR